MKKKLTWMLVMMMLVGALFGCSSKKEDKKASDWKEKKAGEELVVGFDQDFPPMGFVGDDGEFTGFDLDLAKAVCEKLGYKFVPKPIAWDAKDAELQSGGIDCVWNGFTINGREDAYTWSEPYLKNKQVFVVRKDSEISSEVDLKGKIVCVQTDSSAQVALENNSELSATFGTLQVVADYNTGFMDLESGAVDAVAMDIVVAAYQIEKRGDDFQILDYEISAEEYGVGFALGNEALRNQVQKALEELAKDGTVEEISKKWFREDITTILK